jgi:glycosyltransferase involved in cell wall biosynthesis
MGMLPPVPDRPTVSVIVPARNEEACLATCLESLVSQEGISKEILVVDDHSTDRTRQTAQSFPGVRVIEAGPLPTGWSGKNNALTAGAQQARGQWLLFTDADTVHKPGSLARAVAEAEAHSADLLSYSPEQEVHGFWERAVMPVIFAELARKYPPSKISDGSSGLAAANGQYLLISRAAYDAVGGHRAVASSLLEDVALARAVREASGAIRFRYGGEAVRTRMYRGFRQLREGWTKNLRLLFPEVVPLAILRTADLRYVGRRTGRLETRGSLPAPARRERSPNRDGAFFLEFELSGHSGITGLLLSPAALKTAACARHRVVERPHLSRWRRHQTSWLMEGHGLPDAQS